MEQSVVNPVLALLRVQEGVWPMAVRLLCFAQKPNHPNPYLAYCTEEQGLSDSVVNLTFLLICSCAPADVHGNHTGSWKAGECL